MDEVGIAVREARISELELENRHLYEQIAELNNQLQGQQDMVDEAHRLAQENYNAVVGQRNERIVGLERENNALRKREQAALAYGRTKQDAYDELCTKIGATA